MVCCQHLVASGECSLGQLKPNDWKITPSFMWLGVFESHGRWREQGYPGAWRRDPPVVSWGRPTTGDHNSLAGQKENHCERVSLAGNTVSEKPQRNRGTQQDPKGKNGKSRTCLRVGTWSQGRWGGEDFRTKDSSQSVRVTWDLVTEPKHSTPSNLRSWGSESGRTYYNGSQEFPGKGLESSRSFC